MTKITEISQISSDSGITDDEDKQIRKFAKHMLKKHVFVGTFLEKRFVEPLQAYRDVIKICDDEKKLIKDLMVVKKRCAKHFDQNTWIGITDPETIGAPAGYNIWVTLKEEVFGSYFYEINNVEFTKNEIKLKLAIVNNHRNNNITNGSIYHSATNKSSRTNCIEEIINNESINSVGLKMSSFFISKLDDLWNILTYKNFKEALVFLFVVISTAAIFAIEATKFLLDYFPKLMRESSGFIKACSPIILGIIGLVKSTIMGFYSLIAVMWVNRKPKQINNYNNLTVPYSPYVKYNDFSYPPSIAGNRNNRAIRY